VDIHSLAQVMDAFFWNFLAQAVILSERQRNAWMDSSAHLIYHALFADPPAAAQDSKHKMV